MAFQKNMIKVGFYFDKPFYLVQKSKWNYPYHLIDFETTKTALPFYKDMRPYQSIGFQFSHHTLDEMELLNMQDEFICVEPGEFPSYKFVRALMNAYQMIMELFLDGHIMKIQFLMVFAKS
jgi:hypothetical protein